MLEQGVVLDGQNVVEIILEVNGKKINYLELPKGRHPRDAYDDIQETLYCLFKRQKKYYLKLLNEGIENDSPYLFSLTWIAGALQYKESIDYLIQGLKKKDKFIRWSCCSSIIQFEDEKIIIPLIDSLKDRSTDIRSTALEGVINQFGMLSLVTYFSFLLALLLLSKYFHIILAIFLASGVWFAFAIGQIFLWNYFKK